jgi:hypothetical protein
MADQPTIAQPDPARVPRPASHKIAVGMVGGAITIIFVWILSVIGTALGAPWDQILNVPNAVAQAFTTVVSTWLALRLPDDMAAP